MRFRLLASDCEDGDCPKVYEYKPDADYVALQGYRLSDDELAELGEIPPGEIVIKFPRALLAHIPTEVDA